MIKTTIPETRTDPKDVTTQAEGLEILEAIIDSYMDDGAVPSTVMLTDQNGEQHEICVDFITWGEKCALETIANYWEDEAWDDCRAVVEELLAMPKDWLNTMHDVEVV